MQKSPSFDYNQPSRDTLAGVNLEVSDTDREGVVTENAAPAKAILQPLPLVCLYGHIITVQDDANLEIST